MGARTALHCLGALCLAAHGIAAAAAPSNDVLSLGSVAQVGGGNALSTPAARHVARMDSGTYLLALQRDLSGTSGQTGLGLYRSDDDAQSWTFYASLNPSASDRHTVDLVKSGDDLALVQSFDAPSILPDSTLDPRRKVYFQWWRSDGKGGWSGDGRVTVFDPAPGEAYHRAELAIDAQGRIWVQAFKRRASACNPASDPRCAVCNTPGNGDNYPNDLVVSMSADGGRSFAREQVLASTICRAGGRLISAGKKLVLIWNDYSGNEKGTKMVTSFVTRDAVDPPAAWSVPAPAFPDEPADGIYHGAALSAVADGASVHLVYKDQNQLRLWYRRFDVAAGSFGARVLIDDSEQDWALQPATTLRNGDVFIFANHLLAEGKYETRMWRLSAGLGAGKAAVLGSEDAFHGYPSVPETLPASARTLPYVYTRAPTSSGSGDEMVLRVATEPPPAVLGLEAGRALLPAGKSIAIRIQTTAGIGGTLTLDVAGLPAGVRAAFDRPQVAAGEVVQLTLTAEPGAKAASASCELGVTSASGRATLAFRIDLVAAPSVSLHGPDAGAPIHGKAHIEVDAAASAGYALSELQLLLDGSPVATATGSPASFEWDSTTAPDGAHDLSAMAVDDLGNAASAPPLRIEVRNHQGGGCASAGSGEPLFALAVALVALKRKRRGMRVARSGQFTLPGCISGKGAISASNCLPSSVTIR